MSLPPDVQALVDELQAQVDGMRAVHAKSVEIAAMKARSDLLAEMAAMLDLERARADADLEQSQPGSRSRYWAEGRVRAIQEVGRWAARALS